MEWNDDLLDERGTVAYNPFLPTKSYDEDYDSNFLTREHQVRLH